MSGKVSLWRNVPADAIAYAEASAPVYAHTIKLANKPSRIWYNPESRILFFNAGPDKDFKKVAGYKSALSKAPGISALCYDWTNEPDLKHGPWVRFPSFNLCSVFDKTAEEGTAPFNYLAQAG